VGLVELTGFEDNEAGAEAAVQFAT